MKKLTKKMLCLVLAVLFVASVFAGCNNNPATESSAPSGDGSSATTSGGGSNADREKVNITFSQPSTGIDNPDRWGDDPIKKAIEEAVNIELTWHSGSDGYETKLETDLMGGRAPDLFCNYGELEKTSKWIDEGMVTNIGEIIKADPERYPILNMIINSPTYRMYNEYYSGDPDTTYALYALTANISWAGVSVYNKALMNQAGFEEAPKTVDEFVEFANTLGEQGVIGWWPRNNKLANTAGLNEMDKTICAPNGTTMMPPSGNAWEGFQPVDPENVEGEWKLMTTSEETKECIKILADMYAKGGLDNSIGTKDDFAGATDDFVAGKIGAVNYGFSSYGQYDWIVTDKWLNGNPDGSYEDLVLGTPLSGDAGMAVSYNAPYWMGFNWFIPDSCENPERVLDLIEFIATDAGQSLIFDGTEDMFTVDADGNITRDADKWKEVNDIYNVVDGRTQYLWFIYLFAGSQEKLELESATDWYEASMNTIKVDRYPEGPQKDYGTGVLDSYGLDAYGELPAYFTIIPYSDEANEIRTQLADITLRYIPAFIAGQKDIDAEWDAYVAEYEAAGAAQIEQEFNEGIQTAKAAYDSYQK